MMGVFSKLLAKKTTNGAGKLLDSAGNFANNLRGAITGEENQLKFTEMLSKLAEARLKISEIEAQHDSVFVAGWRPMLGWCLSIAIGLNVLIRPILSIFGINIPDIPPAAFTLMNILLGVVVGTRTLEKFGGVQSKH